MPLVDRAALNCLVETRLHELWGVHRELRLDHGDLRQRPDDDEDRPDLATWDADAGRYQDIRHR